MTNQIKLGRIFASRGTISALTIAEMSVLIARHAAGARRVSGSGTQIVSEFAAAVHRESRQHLQVWVVTEPRQSRTLLMLHRETPYRDGDIEFDRTDGVVAEEVASLTQAFGGRPSQRAMTVRISQTPLTQPRPAQNPAAHASGPPKKPNRPPNRPQPTERRLRDGAYWDESADLVLEYLELSAGALFNKDLLDGFIAWLKRSPDVGRRYVEGTDMDRAALVERYLKLRALPRV